MLGSPLKYYRTCQSLPAHILGKLCSKNGLILKKDLSVMCINVTIDYLYKRVIMLPMDELNKLFDGLKNKNVTKEEGIIQLVASSIELIFPNMFKSELKTCLKYYGGDISDLSIRMVVTYMLELDAKSILQYHNICMSMTSVQLTKLCTDANLYLFDDTIDNVRNLTIHYIDGLYTMLSTDELMIVCDKLKIKTIDRDDMINQLIVRSLIEIMNLYPTKKLKYLYMAYKGAKIKGRHGMIEYLSKHMTSTRNDNYVIPESKSKSESKYPDGLIEGNRIEFNGDIYILVDGKKYKYTTLMYIQSGAPSFIRVKNANTIPDGGVLQGFDHFV